MEHTYIHLKCMMTSDIVLLYAAAVLLETGRVLAPTSCHHVTNTNCFQRLRIMVIRRKRRMVMVPRRRMMMMMVPRRRMMVVMVIRRRMMAVKRMMMMKMVMRIRMTSKVTLHKPRIL